MQILGINGEDFTRVTATFFKSLQFCRRLWDRYFDARSLQFLPYVDKEYRGNVR